MKLDQALVVFHNHGNHWADRWLRPGFRHVFVCIQTETAWLSIDGKAGLPDLDIVARKEYDLASFYRQGGFAVVRTCRRPAPFQWPMTVTNCVGLTKVILGITAPFVVTPWQLFRYLEGPKGLRLPGKSMFNPPKPDDPPPPLPEPEDPEIKAAGEKARKSQLERRGRRASIKTSASGLEDELGIVARPTASAQRQPQLLGGSL